jgi:hypothetical protein
MKVLFADALIALLLRSRPKVTFRELRELRDRISKAIPDLIVDISGPSIDSALFYYPKLFVEKENSITRALEAEKILKSDFIENEFLSSFTEEFKQKLESLLAA